MHFRVKDDNILSRSLKSNKTDEDIIVDDRDLRKIEELLKHHLGILSQDIHRKLDLLLEGQARERKTYRSRLERRK